ncbi:MAG: TonB-dependent receptor [Bryobacteraceae bacterium]|nr:TonB-dependent receptor [Bryobacteraceae bacterium]
MVRLPLCLFFALACAFGQVQSARLEGTVKDASGAVIPAAKLQVTNVRTQVQQSAESDSEGFYAFPLLQPGLYNLTVEAGGFRKAAIANIEMTVGITLRQDVPMELGAVAETITVEASNVRVQTTDATIQRAVTLRDIDTLPQLARNPIVLATYQPGVQINPADNSFSRVNGLRQGSNNNTLDGIDVNDSVLPRLGLTLNATNTDSVEEFRIITNGAKAEYGRNAGGQVELITRSGTNDPRGNLFWYHRNTVLNANNFFNKTAPGVPESPRPKFLQNTYGGSFGGPIVLPKIYNGKDKLFFFFNFQGQRTAQEVVRNRTVLTPEAKSGIFRWRQTATAPIQSFDIVRNDPRGIGIDRAVARNLALLPNPNNTDVGDGLNTAGFRFNAPASSENEQITFKSDYNVSSTHRIWGRYSRFRTLTPADTLNNAEATFPGQPSGSQGGIRWGYAVGSSWTIRPWLVNEFIAGHQESTVDFFRVRSLTPGEARISSNLFTDPLPTGFGSRRNSPVDQITDNLSILRGKHSFKAGVRFALTTQLSSNDANIWPTISLTQNFGNAAPGTIGPAAGTIVAADRLRFDNLYNDLLGRVSSINTTFYSDLEKFQTVGTPRDRNFKFRDYSFYFQDDWRVLPRLTLNLGLRYEFYGVPFEKDGLQGNVVQSASGLVHPGANIADLTVRRGVPWMNNDWNNFAPRFGFAWAPGKEGKTSIRGSFGIFYDRVIGATANDVDGNMPGFAAAIQVFPNQATGSDRRVSDNPTLPAAPSAPVLTLAPTRGQATLALFDPYFRTPYVAQMNFTIQREILRNTVLELGYVGNRGIKQLMDVNYNQTRIYDGFLADFQQLAAMRNNTPATNAIVRMFGGNAAQAVSTIGATNLTQGNVGTAANTIDTSNYTRYATAGVGQFYLRNFPQFQTVAVGTNAGRTYYNSFQASVRRQTGAVRFALNYTWSKTMDNSSVDGSGLTSPVDSFNLRLNRALSDIDRTHTFNWTASYFIPIGKGKAIGGGMPDWADRLIGGWELGSLGIYTSGPTMTISSGLTTGPTTNATWGNFSGPDRSIGAVEKIGTGVRYFSVDQVGLFSQPAAGFIGSSGRNAFRGPHYFNTDLSLVKRFRVVGEKLFVTFRAEAYNLLNNAFFATPGLNLQTPQSFGVISATTGNPRIYQMALRVDF